ncbi:hypothetical protein [Thermomonas sp.]|uniref:hypothetical protein n=1 Tax=Thermomonas sp. TaxID=1971895 RepID=UPI002622D1DC|nr:hypothetical protein [Thermomonas sp.]MCO5054240.1 hypothetical protein [Thermomonas sp.]HRO63999.1 hypothetical protein [Thermomonas sp.]
MFALRQIPRLFLPMSLCVGGLAHAQASAQGQPPREVVLPIENVRYDYAQVMSVRPVQQVLRTTNRERVCSDPQHPETQVPVPAGQDSGRLRNCRMAPVVREFRRTIAYDVDYVYRGSRFRTRMGSDPGNRLRIRISIMPAPLN